MNQIGLLEKINIGPVKNRPDIPIGTIYTQYPNQPEPKNFYGFGVWRIINNDGSFNRSSGGEAQIFEKQTKPQDDAMFRLTGYLGRINSFTTAITSISGCFYPVHYGTTGLSVTSSQSMPQDTITRHVMRIYFDNIRSNYPSTNTNLSNKIANENRPINRTIRTWERIK